jgi:tetratricopeptide (TPR) repeat protein
MHFDQGRQNYARRDYDNASDYFKRAVNTDPMFHEAHRYLAEAYEKLGYRHRARKAWEALLRITKGSEEQQEIQQRISEL